VRILGEPFTEVFLEASGQLELLGTIDKADGLYLDSRLVAGEYQLVGFYSDWLWFGETGYRSVFLRILVAKWLTGAVGMGVAFAALWINLRLALRSLASRQLVMVTSEGQVRINVDRGRVGRIALLAAGLLAVLFGLYTAGQWLEWLFFRNAQPFGAVDPILGHDASFYVFRLPLLAALQSYLFSLLALSALGVAAVYGAAGALSFDRRLRISPRALRHLSVLVAGIFVVVAFGAYLDVPELLFSPAGILHGVANADEAVRIPARRALMVASLVGAGLALFQMSSRSWWPIGTAVGLSVGVTLAGSLGASLVQRLVIAPDGQARETADRVRNSAAARAAGGSMRPVGGFQSVDNFSGATRSKSAKASRALPDFQFASPRQAKARRWLGSRRQARSRSARAPATSPATRRRRPRSSKEKA
jgi:uncharacterized membrane protein (UPF0182 family)